MLRIVGTSATRIASQGLIQTRNKSWKSGQKAPNVAICGVTGAVGQEFVKLLVQRNFPHHNVKFLASARSAGSKISYKGKDVVVEETTEKSFDDVDIALFSAGGKQSERYAPIAASKGCVVVDNSSAFRMDPQVPLVVPEVNPEDIFKHKGIIANPNCSTIIMNVAVYPLYKAFGVQRVSVATYQAASGAGAAAMEDLELQAKEWVNKKPFSHNYWKRQYIWNLFSHNSKIILETGYNEEETKMIKETRKIFHDDSIMVTATCVRVPVLRAHSEAINITLKNPTTEAAIREVLAKAPGVSIIDDRVNNRFPEPLDASGQDNVFVGRMRSDVSQPKGMGFEMFVVGDQLLKGAALNAVQIAEKLL